MLLSSSGNCLTEIDWSTEYACARDRVSTSWIITNPVTHHTYNLTGITSPLSSNHVDGGTEYTYTLGLGGHNITCGDRSDADIGACQRKVSDHTTFVIGRVNNNLTLIDGKVHVDYLGGDSCRSTKMPRRASISFQYSPTTYLKVLPEEECEYSFIVYTPLVKEDIPFIGQECHADNFPEMGWFLSYKIPPLRISSSVTAYISVCRPISSENQVDTVGSSSCVASNSAACIVTGGYVHINTRTNIIYTMYYISYINYY